MFKLMIAYLIVSFIVNLKCLDRPEGFSWKDTLNPFGPFLSGWEMSHSDAFLRSAFYNAPFGPVFLILHLTSAPEKKTDSEDIQDSESDNESHTR